MRRFLVLVGMLTAAGSVAQGPPENVSLFGKRYDAFRSMFAQRGLAVGSRQAFEQIPGDEAADWIVVALGDVSSLPSPIGGWRRFVHNGGSLLVATDHGDAPTDEFGLKFQPQSVLAPPDAECYPPDQRDCPLVTNMTEGSPLFTDINVLALNRSGYLDVFHWADETTVARLPPGTRDSENRNVGGKPVVYGAADPAGRYLFAADHSLFINETMLNHEDQVLNAPFAANTVDWLIAGRDPQRLKVLFLEDGQPIDEWIDPRYVTGDWPTSTFQDKLQTLDKLLRAVNKLILEQQHRRDPNTGLTLYNQAVRNWESRQRPTAFLQAALWGLTAFLMMTTAAWILGRRRTYLERPSSGQGGDRPAQPPPYGPKSEDDPAQRSLLDRRRIEMLEEGHYVDLARRLSRVWLTQQTGAPPAGPPEEPSAFRGAPPRLRVRWREAWVLATDGDHAPMTLVQFQRFRTDLASIQLLLDRQRRTLDPSGFLDIKENA